jgi:hypothetical protein
MNHQPTAGIQDIGPIAAQELHSIASDTYVFGYPLVLVDLTRTVSLTTSSSLFERASLNRLVHSRAFPDHTFHDVVSPNADTLYSTAWIDLTQGPVVLGVPEMDGRYYVMQLLDAWTNVFADPGTRTTGQGRHDFAIVGPGWSGRLPAGLERIDAPTNTVWLIGRTFTAGKGDYAAVHAVQDSYSLTPLERAPTRPAPAMAVGLAAHLPPVEQIATLDAVTYFSRLAALMDPNPPAPVDGPMVQQMALIGLQPGRPFLPEALGPGASHVLAEAVRAAQQRIVEAVDAGVKRVNGWSVHADTGRYGTNYLHRAAIAQVGLGANLSEDAVYPFTAVDENGQPLDGARSYELRFEPGQLPPVNAFWSVAVYDADHFFVENALDRHALGDRDPVRFAPDGSLALYLQHEPPEVDRLANWLPTPEAPFNLIMRLYDPRRSVFDGSWKPPAVRVRQTLH